MYLGDATLFEARLVPSPPKPPAIELDPQLPKRLCNRVLRTAPHLADMAEDLAQETLADLIAYLGNRPAPPPDEIWALASTILRRRIADQHRDALKKIVRSFSPEDLPDAPSTEDVEHLSAVRQLLWVVLGFLAGLDARSRTLLLGSEGPTGAGSPLSVADRKKLSRLRERLRKRVRESLGADAGKILRE